MRVTMQWAAIKLLPLEQAEQSGEKWQDTQSKCREWWTWLQTVDIQADKEWQEAAPTELKHSQREGEGKHKEHRKHWGATGDDTFYK